ncbi:MAG TPA: hypothetical protein PLI19_04375, partial [Erysipelotrichaceae bacterium]|nr:hypothetical protein [Erysipelotrichaceae bacterium]
MNNKASLWALQLIKYFMVSKEYLQVSVISNFKIDKKEIDYWLVNERNPHFPIIHISNDNDQTRTGKYQFLAATAGKIRSLIRSEAGSVLDISFNEGATNYNFADVQYIRLQPNTDVLQPVMDSFPEISTVIYDVENIENEKKKIEKDLAVQSVQSSQKAKSEREKLDLKQGMCASFLVPAIISILVFIGIQLFRVIFDTSLLNSAIIFGAYYKAYITIFHQVHRFLRLAEVIPCILD